MNSLSACSAAGSHAGEPGSRADASAGSVARTLIHPDTGVGSGRFDAEYKPAEGLLNVTLRVAFNFVGGDRSDSAWIASVGGPENAARYADDQFTWTPQEQEEWKENATAKVRDVWSGRYRFHIQRACWERLPPVDVAISILSQAQLFDQATGAEIGPAGGGPHHVFWIRKYPTEPGRRDQFEGGRELHLNEQGADGAGNPDSRHNVVSTDKEARYRDVVAEANPSRIDFARGSDVITGAQEASLHEFGAALARPDMPPFPITVTGHASSEGAEQTNMTLSESRARNVSSEIVKGGAKTQPQAVGVGENKAAPTPDWRVAEITIGKLESDQVTVAHEFGHILGLGDEYPEDAQGRPVGKEAAHSKRVQQLMPGEAPILAHHDDSIMSVGEVVRPRHYVGFLDALTKLTGTEGRDWGVQPAPTRGPGDFPKPAPGPEIPT